jgi:hypothetical protein
VPPEEEGAEEGKDQPKRKRLDHVPLGIRKPSSPKFDSSQFAERQRKNDDAEERKVLDKAERAELESPEIHQDYELKDGEEFDRHLEGISSVNAMKELIAQAKEEIEEELDITIKPFSILRMDELMVFTKEAITGYGEGPGYAELKKRVRELIIEDVRFAQDELDRKKEAYLRSSGK